MLGTHFYNETIRKTVIGFGTLFNNIELKRKNNTGQIIQTMKVPLAYGPREKFLSRLEEVPDLLENKKTQITLPRLSFEMISISYDSSRKINTIQKINYPSANPNNIKMQYTPVPYNLEFELNIIGKNNDDVLQIVEQILPYFQPTFTITINMNSEMGDKRDIPITLNNINIQDNYEDDFSNKRSLIYSLDFTVKTYFYGPISTNKIIKEVNIDYYNDIDSSSKDKRYKVKPSALKDYTNDGINFNSSTSVNINTNTITIPNHGFVTGDFVQYKNGNSTSIGGLTNQSTYYIQKIDNNNLKLAVSKLNATQGYTIDLTSTSSGSNHKFSIINQSDDILVEADDNFGFNEEWL